MTHDPEQPARAEGDLAEASRILRRELEGALAEAHRKDPRRAAPLAVEAEQAPRDWRDAEIARLKAELAAANRAHQAVVEQLEAAVRARDERDAEVMRLLDYLEALMGSTSWRLTAPVRALMDRLRRQRPPG